MDPSTMLSLAFLLIGLGFLLLVAELFIPSMGVLFALSLAALAVGVTLAFIYDTTTGIITLICVFIALPVVLGFMFYLWPKTPIGKRFFLPRPDDDATV